MLRAVGWLYTRIADVRNALYDRGSFRSHDLGGRTISVGNITAGGTGKTPLVAYVAEILADAGEKVCILTRGYRRENPRSRVLVSNGKDVLADVRTGGDEPVELARKLVGKAIVVADADRVAAAAWAKEELGVTAFVLDDGFQHRRARRDLDIVCIDATDPCGSGRGLPAGRLRERLANIARADVVVITRANLVDNVDAIRDRLRRRNSEAPIFVSSSGIVSITRLGTPEKATGLEETRILAFCALGNPDAFFADLQRVSKENGFEVAAARKFRDHHRYSQSDVASLERQARESGATALITTAKDAVKLESLKFELPCFVAASEIEMNQAEAFRELITSS